MDLQDRVTDEIKDRKVLECFAVNLIKIIVFVLIFVVSLGVC